MKRMAGMLALTLAVGIAAGIIGNHVLNAQQQPVTRTILQQKDLEGVAGREVIMYRAEVVPGGVAGRHYHPGPEVLYVLEGALILEHDGQSPVTLKAEESAHVPAKHIHNAKNASTTEPVKVMVFLVGEKGQPLATPVQYRDPTVDNPLGKSWESLALMPGALSFPTSFSIRRRLSTKNLRHPARGLFFPFVSFLSPIA